MISKFFKGALVALVLTLPWYAYGETLNEHQLREKAIARLDAASRWLIEEGVSLFSSSGKDGLHKKLIDNWAVALWADPAVESDDYLAMFRIKARRNRYAIHNLYREEIGGKRYEFWLIKKVYEPLSGMSNQSVFFVTEADGKFDFRKVLKQSDQFFDTFKIDGKKSIKLPTDDLRILYDMQAWEFPKNYKKSDLKNFEVFIDSDRQYKARRFIDEKKI